MQVIFWLRGLKVVLLPSRLVVGYARVGHKTDTAEAEGRQAEAYLECQTGPTDLSSSGVCRPTAPVKV